MIEFNGYVYTYEGSMSMHSVGDSILDRDIHIQHIGQGSQHCAEAPRRMVNVESESRSIVDQDVLRSVSSCG